MMPCAMFSDSRKVDTRWSMSPASPATPGPRRDTVSSECAGLGSRLPSTAGSAPRLEPRKAGSPRQLPAQEAALAPMTSQPMPALPSSGRALPAAAGPQRARHALTRVRPEGEGVEAACLAHLIKHIQVGIHVVGIVRVGCREARAGARRSVQAGAGRPRAPREGRWHMQHASMTCTGSRGHAHAAKKRVERPGGPPGLCLEFQSCGLGMCLLGRRSGLDSSSTRSKPETCGRARPRNHHAVWQGP